MGLKSITKTMNFSEFKYKQFSLDATNVDAQRSITVVLLRASLIVFGIFFSDVVVNYTFSFFTLF